MIFDIDHRRRMIELLQRRGDNCGELAIDQQQPALAVPQDERNSLRVQSVIDGVEDCTGQRHAEMRFQHGRCIGREDGDGVARLDASRDECRGKAIAALACLLPRPRQIAVHHRHALRMDEGGPIQEAKRRQGHMVRFAAVKARSIGFCAHGLVSLAVW
jgi:hypothetical protein